MSTVSKLIDETKGLLQSFSLDEEQATTLTADITSPTAQGFTIGQIRGVATGASPGILEIGSELLFADSVGQDGSVTVPPWGRGYLNTTATTHTAGARVVSQPSFPRAKVLDALNSVLERIFPDLFAIRQVELTVTLPVITYALPADAQSVLTAKWQVPDGRQYWQTVKHWRVSPGGGTIFGDQGVTVDIGDYMTPGRPLQIIYAAKPGQLVAETDDFTTVTGLTASIEDVVTLGAASLLTVSQELSRLQMSSVEQQNRAQLVAPSAALTSSRFLEQRYQQRLLEERKALQRLYPPRITGGWL
jgi:hypothetical protein